MEIQYQGATSVKLITKKAHIVVDPVSDITSLSTDKKMSHALVAQDAFTPEARESLFIINSPGEYEFEDCSVKGVSAQAFQMASGDKSATIYRVNTSEASVLVVGNINEKLSEDQLEKIGMVDIVVIPVGGNGYTLDAVGAASVVRAVDPKLVIPLFYAEDGLKYEVPPATLELFVKELGVPLEEAADKLKIKQLPERLTIQPLKTS